jgi:alkaline phosphatase D
MILSLTRRTLLKLAITVGAVFGLHAQATAETQVSDWENTHDRVFLGGQFWANPMEDWRVKNGAAECLSGGGFRNIQLLTHELTGEGDFRMSVELQRVVGKAKDGGAGFQVGMRADIEDHRANAFSRNGYRAGIQGDQLLLLRKTVKLTGPRPEQVLLTLESKAGQLTLSAADAKNGKALGSIRATLPPKALRGNVALVNNYDPKAKGARYRFSEWRVGGDAFSIDETRRFGPILWSQYSLSDSRGPEGFVMKISALTGPMGAKDNTDVELQIQQNGAWKSLGTAALDTDAWTATFRIPNWNEKVATPFRLVYQGARRDGAPREAEWTGIIRANPTGRPLRLGALTCQNDYGFPYKPVADNLLKLDPDLLYFSGDQLYEHHGGYGLIREPAEPAILNYLRKFYMHGWSFREAMRDRPTLCIPDDHDVFHGNIWGEGGIPMPPEAKGTSSWPGYREPARMVNVVHKTNAAHHPDFYDPTPVKQGISVYYGDMVYGDVSFAIIADRQWKSGPGHVDTGGGRPDHVHDKDFDTSSLDNPGLVLLGERQEAFLRKWAKDWRGHSMKVLMSQTVFAGMATHHGKFDGYLKADLDSGGWPQAARNRAIDILRESMALHVNGDQHLASLAQYGVHKQRDSNWSYCTPAIAAGYPRWWRSDEVGIPYQNRPKHGLANTGEMSDGLGNMVYVYAVGDPIVPDAKQNRYARAHQKGSGFGFVHIDTKAKTYELHAFRFLVDAANPKPEDQFPGWPVIIHQAENRGENRLN